MIPDFSGDYVSAKSVNDGDIMEILDEGRVEYSDVLKKDTFNLKVKINDKIKSWTPNNKHGQLLQKTFGMDTKTWIGQKIQVSVIEDKMLIKPITATSA